MTGKGLESKLKRLAAGPPRIVDGWRQMATGAAGPLAAVAVEIDETVFPRRLGLRNAAGDVVWAVVVHRRLQRLVEPAPDSLSEFSHLFEDGALDAEPETLAQLSRLLRRHAGEPAELWVRPEPAGDGSGPAGSGVSAAVLAEAWSVSLEAPGDEAPAAPLDAFLAAAAGRGADWIVEDGSGEIEGQGGEFEAQAPNDTLLEAWRTARAAMAPGCAILRAGDGTDRSLVCATDGLRHALVQLQGVSAGEIARLWENGG